MSLKVERLGQEPIIIATLSGTITMEMVKDLYAQSAALIDEIGGRTYRITDIRQSDISFSDLMLVLAEVSEGLPGSPSDSRITGALLGSHGWSSTFSNSVQQDQYHNLNIPRFDEMDEAMAYIREQMAAA